jgi:sensor domain CHASE-containing protein
MVVLAAFTLIFSSVGFTLGWTLRKSEDKQDAAHEQALIEHAVDVTEGKIDKRMRLILACRDVGGPLK